MSKNLFYILLLFVITNVAFAAKSSRKPAIEPVIGLSIDQYKQTTNDNGYNWQNRSVASKKPQSKFPYWIGLLLLPLVSVYLLKKRTPSKSNQIFDESVVHIDKFKSKSEDDDTNFPMAS